MESEPKINLGMYIVGGLDRYFDSRNFDRWSKIGVNIIAFTDSRLDGYTKRWLDMGAIDLATEKIPILDWYIENAKGNLNDAKYKTFYSDLCRWYIIRILNKEYPRNINGFIQASWQYKERAPAEIQARANAVMVQKWESDSQGEFVIYGHDRNFMLDGQIELRIKKQDLLSRVCLGLDLAFEYGLSKGGIIEDTVNSTMPYQMAAEHEIKPATFPHTRVAENFNGEPIFMANLIKISIENPTFNESQIITKLNEIMSEGGSAMAVQEKLLTMRDGLSVNSDKDIRLVAIYTFRIDKAEIEGKSKTQIIDLIIEKEKSKPQGMNHFYTILKQKGATIAKAISSSLHWESGESEESDCHALSGLAAYVPKRQSLWDIWPHSIFGWGLLTVMTGQKVIEGGKTIPTFIERIGTERGEVGHWIHEGGGQIKKRKSKRRRLSTKYNKKIYSKRKLNRRVNRKTRKRKIYKRSVSRH